MLSVLDLLFSTGRIKIHCIHNITDNIIVTGDVLDLGLQPDYISMNCSINYRGNTPPPFHFTWIIKDGDDVTQNASTQTLANIMVISTVVVQASEHWNSLQLICLVWIKCSNFVSAESKDFTVVWVSPVLQPMCMYSFKSEFVIVINLKNDSIFEHLKIRYFYYTFLSLPVSLLPSLSSPFLPPALSQFFCLNYCFNIVIFNAIFNLFSYM